MISGLAVSRIKPSLALSRDEVDVIVVGSGLAGLTAATLIEEAGFSQTIVEAKNRIGGRCHTLTDLPGAPEAGGSSVGSMYGRFLDYCDRLGVARKPVSINTLGSHIHINGTNILEKDWPEHSFNPFKGNAKELTPSAYRFRMIRRYRLFEDLDSWQEDKITSKDQSVRDMMLSNGHNEYEIRLGMDTNPGYGHTVDDLSSVHMMHVSNFASHQIQSQGVSFWKIEGGNSSLVNAMASSLKGNIHLNSPVSLIRQSNNRVEVLNNNGETFSARRVIVTTPFSALRYVRFDPILTGMQAEAVNTLPYGECFHALLESKYPYWEDDGLPPGIWMDKIPGRISMLGNSIGLYVFATGRLAQFLNRLPKEDAEKQILFSLKQARPASDGKVKILSSWSWVNDPYAGGMYAYWRPGMIRRYKNKMSEVFGLVHFAGEHTSDTTRGLEGAMESGERAAFEVLDVLG